MVILPHSLIQVWVGGGHIQEATLVMEDASVVPCSGVVKGFARRTYHSLPVQAPLILAATVDCDSLEALFWTENDWVCLG